MLVTDNINSTDNRHDVYKILSLHEHILRYPNPYIGSATNTRDKMWIYNNDTKQIVLEEIQYVPGLYKIINEIILNAYDHCLRDSICKIINITINRSNNTITVHNNGNGIPIQLHRLSKVYLPEMILSHPFTSTNDNHRGIGAKLTNIFSEHFTIETVDCVQKKKYVQTFSNNMKTVNPAQITDIDDVTEPYTKITFKPDLKFFGMNNLTDDIVKLFAKRAFDLTSNIKDVKIYFNDELIQATNV